MKKNICFFNGDMSRGGGTERITQILANELSKLDKYQVIVFSLNNESKETFYELNRNVKHIVLNNKKTNLIIYILKLLRIVKKHKIDIIINVDIMLGIFSIPIKLLLGTKVIAWEHFNIKNNIGTSKSKIIRILSLNLCDYYVNLTRSDYEAFKKEFKIRCKHTFIYNPVMPNEHSAKYEVTSKKIITAGHFYHTKGFDLAVEVAKLTFDKHPDWIWEFYGDGPEFDKINEMIKSLNLSKNIKLCGRNRDLHHVYPQSSIYVMTSRNESFGLVLTEAQVNNLPIIAFDVPFGPREIIVDGVNGFLIERFNIQKMAEKISLLINNENLRMQFSNKAQINHYKFDIRNIRKEWEVVIDS